MATRIRAATLDDVEQIVALGIDMHAESPNYSRLRFSPEKVRKLAARLLTGTMTTPAAGGVFVAERDGALVGMAAGTVVQQWLSDDHVLMDYVIYVQPSERGSSAGLKLIRALEKWGHENGAAYAIIAVSTGVDTDGVAEMFKRIGYRDHGRALLKEF